MEDLTVLSPIGELSTSSWRLAAPSWRYWLPPHCLLVDNYFLFLENFTFWPVSDVTIGLLAFFFPGGLVRTFSSSSARHFCHCLDCSPWTNLSWWFRRYGRNSLIHENLLWYFVFIVFVICLVTTFIGRLLYFLLPTLRSDFYSILF